MGLACELGELLLELVDTTCCVQHLLLTGVEWVALGADFNVEAGFAHGGAGHKGVAARAGYRQIGIFWVNAVFHFISFGHGRRGFAYAAGLKRGLCGIVSGLTRRKQLLRIYSNAGSSEYCRSE